MVLRLRSPHTHTCVGNGSSFIQRTSCIRTHCLATLGPTPGKIHKIQVASKLRTLMYPSFRDQVCIFLLAVVANACMRMSSSLWPMPTLLSGVVLVSQPDMHSFNPCFNPKIKSAGLCMARQGGGGAGRGVELGQGRERCWANTNT